ncbi:MAG: phosphotransferase [Muribaculaceae bacterium]|nr:phosphotransferase [Muribaculaceae bacterium]
MNRNAIILAAGKSNRFAPFTYERPKGLFRVKDEILIERQIEQLIQAGINEIYVVVGYMKEKFFYLEQKYKEVKLLINNNFGTKGNLFSLFTARDFLNNSFISYADYYFAENPFIIYDSKFEDNRSFHTCVYKRGKFNGFSIHLSDAGVITHVNLGGEDRMAMIGPAYFNENFSKRFVNFMNQEINDFRINSLFWEEFFERHIDDLTLFAKEVSEDSIMEFNNIDDLRQFDSDFLRNVDSTIISNIVSHFNCNPNEIVDISVINAGLTNVSFVFTLKGKKYVYRHPGGNADNLINRQTEIFSQLKAVELGIDPSVIRISRDGWKLSYLVTDLAPVDFEKYPWQKKKCFEYIHLIHSVEPDETVKVFDIMNEGKRLIKLACASKGNLFKEFKTILDKLDKLDGYLKKDSQENGFPWVLSHGDVYEPNFLATKSGKLYLIDWEYSGINDPAHDINSILTRYEFTDSEIEDYYRDYFGRELTPEEHRHYYGQLPISAFYWLCWGLYKGSIGDDDGFFMLTAYRNIIRFIDKSLALFEEK